ncbi:MAG: outer membrane lipoprotein carrier protein LolA [Gemmatimonadota bacterium]
MQYRSVCTTLLGALLALPACAGDGADGGQAEDRRAQAAISEQPVAESRDASGLEPAAAGPTGDAAEAAGGPAGDAEVQPGQSASSTPVDPPRQAASTGSSPGAGSAPPAAVGTAANDILERAEQVYLAVRSMEADFTQRVYVPLLDDDISSRGRIYHRAPDRFLMRFTDPEGDLIVTDGQYAWMYYPSNDPGQVMRARLAEGGQQVDLQREFLSDATERYSATRTGSEQVGGRNTHALTLRPRGPSPYTQVRLWVDAETFLVRRFQITEANESVRTLEMSNLRTNVELSDALFSFTPPPGAQVIEP